MIYELFDTRSANQVGVFQTEQEALAAVRHGIHLHGSEAVESLALGLEDEAGDTTVIAAGAVLARMAAARVDRVEPRAVLLGGEHRQAESDND